MAAKTACSKANKVAHRTYIQMARPRRTVACYDADRDRVESIIRKQIDEGDDPVSVVNAIVVAALGRDSRLRYRIGSTARLVSLARRFMSEAQLARIVRREFQLSS